ncbi:DUF4391 domain-containing protein [Fusobacterium hominis]|uniref:DUF4391 domain-containing protein n=1 Tax=Fusobacterium hominis TaxID=2764326 RepID=A0A7G9GYD0_9FUSO|nr:DUF4391 domain-containing protein [Fusobacterium hominis]QNM15812.1 DUF4391 domain-containing protein [Fusobacterium hominis]
MAIFNLPKGCKVDKNIPKEIIYKNAEADEKFKRIFIDNVEKIRYEYALTYGNSNIEKYVKDEERYDEIHFIKIVLKEKGKEKIVSKLLHQLIPKATVFIMECDSEILISTAIKRVGNNRVEIVQIYNTDWLDKENERLKEFDYKNLSSGNMKSFYESIVEKVRIINLGKDCEDIEKEDIEILETLNREIEELKMLRKKETQVNRVVKIQNELLKKIKERNYIIKK